MRGLFVTGTGTGVGKTVALRRTARGDRRRGRAGERAQAGGDRCGDPPGEWPPDHELLARIAGMTPEEVAPLRYGPAVSPHLAAELAGEHVDPERIAATAEAALRSADARGAVLIVEGVGGLLVPLAEGFTVRDLAARLGLPLLVAASPGLGTINHTLLTLESASTAGLEVRAVVLTPWPTQPDAMEESNRATIARFGDVEVAGLARVSSPDRPHSLRPAESCRGDVGSRASVPSQARRSIGTWSDVKTRCSFPRAVPGSYPRRKEELCPSLWASWPSPCSLRCWSSTGLRDSKVPWRPQQRRPRRPSGALEKNLHGLLSPESYPRRKESHACANKHPDRSQVYPVRRRTATLFESGGTRRCFEPEGVRFARLRPPTRAASTTAVVTTARSLSEITYGGIV